MRLARAARAGSGMTQPIDSPAQVENSDTESQHDSGPRLAPGAPVHPDTEQQIGWLRPSSEAFHAPGTCFTSRQTIALSALAIVVSGLAVAAMGHFLAPGPVTSQITARPMAARPQARPASSGVPPAAEAATNVTSATASDAPAGPASPAPAPTAAKPEEHPPVAGDTTEHRSNGRNQPLASPPSPAPALPELPERTVARWPSSEDEDQDDIAQPAPPSPDQKPQWHWKKTTTCDSSGRCVNHYNPVRSGQ